MVSFGALLTGTQARSCGCSRVSESLTDEEIAGIQPAIEANPHHKPLMWKSEFVQRLLATITARDARIADLRGELILRGKFLNTVVAEADESKARIAALEAALRERLDDELVEIHQGSEAATCDVC